MENELFGSVSFDWTEYLTVVLCEFGFERRAVERAVDASAGKMDLALSMLLAGNA